MTQGPSTQHRIARKRMILLVFLATSTTATLGGCAESAVTTTRDGGLLNVVETRPDAAPIAPATECVVMTASAATREAPTHLTPCTDTTFDTTPPSEGPHYGRWAAFGVYESPVPWGYLVHSLEHGAVVIAYACGDDCADVPARLRAFYDTYTPDPLCTGTSVPHRLIVVPAPDLDVPIAAAAWGEIYRATCLDEASLRAFVDAHYGRAPEDFCAPGIDDSPGWCG
jgi:hypothetical protein